MITEYLTAYTGLKPDHCNCQVDSSADRFATYVIQWLQLASFIFFTCLLPGGSTIVVNGELCLKVLK